MLRTKKGQAFQVLIAQGFHYLAFILKTQNKEMMFLTKKREERDVLLHELNNICK